MKLLISYSKLFKKVNIKISSIIFASLFLTSFAFSQSVSAEVSEEDKIYWDKNNPLQWSDFEGNVGTFPDYFTGETGDFAAFTITWLEYEYSWAYTQESPCMYQIDYGESWASFVKPHSWVMSEETDDIELLHHEQRHFDIYKIGELKLNEIFKNVNPILLTKI